MSKNIKFRKLLQISAFLSLVALFFAGCSSPNGPFQDSDQSSQSNLDAFDVLDELLNCEIIDNGDGTFVILTDSEFDGRISISEGMTVSPSNSHCLAEEGACLDILALDEGDEIILVVSGLEFVITKEGRYPVITLPGRETVTVIVRSGSNDLTSLMVEDSDIFKPFELNFSAVVAYGVGMVNDIFTISDYAAVNVKKGDGFIPVVHTGNNYSFSADLDIGANVYTITVTAENGSTKEYTLTITRNSIPVTGVTLNKNTLTLNVGATEKLVATVDPSTATNKVVTWVSSRPGIATVEADGTVRAVSGGNATITVTAADGGKTASCAVTVTAPVAVTKITLSPDSLQMLTAGKTFTLTAALTPPNPADPTVTWKSSAPDVAAVEGNGLSVTVKGLKTGSATITATANGGTNISASINVAVKSGDNSLNNLQVNGTAAGGTSPDFTANAGTSATVPVTFMLPAGAAADVKKGNAPVSVTVSGNNRSFSAVLDAGVNGYTITVAAENGDAKIYTLAITRVSGSTTLTITPASFSLYSKGTQQLAVSGYSSGGLSWSSDDASIAAVTQTGLVTAGKVTTSRTTTIRVSSASGSGTARVTVNPSNKNIALTFDDGPDPNPVATSKLLDVLNEKDVHASFFMLGEQIEYNNVTKGLVSRALAENHDVCSHSYTHPWQLSVDAYKKELIDTQEAVYKITGKVPVFFRPPFLDNNANLVKVAAELGLPLVNGELLDDWDPGTEPEYILSNARKYAKNWGILIFHDYIGSNAGGNGENTVKAIPDVIDMLRNQGYEIMSVSEMLVRKGALYLEPGKIYPDFIDRNLSKDPAFPADGVIIPVNKVTVSATSVTLNRAETATVTALVSPGNATHNRTYWYSANSRVATVDPASGLITAIAAGTTTITVRAENEIAKITVTVK